MGHIEVGALGYVLPDGRELFADVSFRVADHHRVALVGANGAGKTTLLRLVAGDIAADTGTVVSSGGLGVMRQFVGSVRDASTVRDLLVSVAPPRIRAAAMHLSRAEADLAERNDTVNQMAYAQALADWGDAGGYDAEVVWDICCVQALGIPWQRAGEREVRTLSGGEQKRLVLEALLNGPDEVLLLDEPDNYLDVPAKRWLEAALVDSGKTILFVSHDRELLARTATKVVTVEGGRAWTHGEGFATYHEARRARHERLDELVSRWDQEHERLKALVRTLQQQAANSPDMASRYHAMQTRLRKFEAVGPPESPPKQQNVRIRLTGGRTGVRVVTCEGLELTGLMEPFDVEIYFGERIAVLGSNGSGKSHFLRLLAGDPVSHSGAWKLGARVVPGHFAQTYEHPEMAGRTLLDLLWVHRARSRGPALAALRRYELDDAADQAFDTLSGGQQARFQILLLELDGSTLLLLDEPTDNLDLASAEALEEGLESFEGTVIAVTHDRWFARRFDRYLVFGADGRVSESTEPIWDEGRVDRVR